MIPPLHQIRIALVSSLNALDMIRLRSAFGDLMDQLAAAAIGHGFDLDDVTIERSLITHSQARGEIIVPADALSNRRRMESLVQQSHAVPLCDIQLTGLQAALFAPDVLIQAKSQSVPSRFHE